MYRDKGSINLAEMFLMLNMTVERNKVSVQ